MPLRSPAWRWRRCPTPRAPRSTPRCRRTGATPTRWTSSATRPSSATSRRCARCSPSPPPAACSSSTRRPPSCPAPTSRRRCCRLAHDAQGRLLSCWLGDPAVQAAREAFHGAGIATYDTPEEAVRAFSLLITYRRNQAQLMQAPPAHAAAAALDLGTVRALIDSALAAGREWLTEPEAKALLAACGVPVVETRVTAPEAEAALVGRAGHRLPGGAEDPVAADHAQERCRRRGARPRRRAVAARSRVRDEEARRPPAPRSGRSKASPCRRWCGGRRRSS